MIIAIPVEIDSKESLVSEHFESSPKSCVKVPSTMFAIF